MGLAPARQIHRRVEIAIGGISATTSEHAVSQRQVVVDGPACRAQLARWVPAVSSQYLAAAPRLFVAQQPGELGPPGIRDRRSEAVVAQHPGHVEVFDDEPVVSLDQHVGHLVQEMPSYVGDVVVVPSELRGGALTVARSLSVLGTPVKVWDPWSFFVVWPRSGPGVWFGGPQSGSRWSARSASEDERPRGRRGSAVYSVRVGRGKVVVVQVICGLP